MRRPASSRLTLLIWLLTFRQLCCGFRRPKHRYGCANGDGPTITFYLRGHG